MLSLSAEEKIRIVVEVMKRDVKAIPVIDDHSRKLLARPVKPDEGSQSASDAMEMALGAAQREGLVIENRPTLLTDNGAGFAGETMAKYLKARGVEHMERRARIRLETMARRYAYNNGHGRRS